MTEFLKMARIFFFLVFNGLRNEISHMHLKRVRFDREYGRPGEYRALREWHNTKGRIHNTLWLGWYNDWTFGVEKEIDGLIPMYRLCGASGKPLDWGNVLPAAWFIEVSLIDYLLDRYFGGSDGNSQGPTPKYA